MRPESGCLKAFLALIITMVIAITARYQWANVQPVVTFPAPLPTPSPNGFDLYLAAAQAVVPFDPPVDEIYDTKPLPANSPERAQRYSLPRREAWLKQNAPAFALFDRACAADSRYPNTRTLTTSMAEHSKFREMARYKVVQSRTLQSEGKWRAAADARLDILEMANDISRGGHLISALVAIACETIAFNDFETIIPHLSAEDCQQLTDRFGQLVSKRPLFRQILTEEKYNQQQAMLNEWAKADAAKKDINIPSPNGLLLSMVWTRRGLIAGNNKLMDAVIAQADKPLRLQKPIEAPNRILDAPNFIFYSSMSRSLFHSTRSIGTLQSQQLRLALRQYFLAKGTYPTTLNQLAPQFLAKVPIDPYGSGETWHYRKENDSYCAWSIGPDGKDDSCKPIRLKGKRKRVVIYPDSSGDVVARP